jgi:dephospho-CoA kinase
MKVIGVVGLPASGKGEFSNVAGAMGIPVVVMGDVIRNAVKKAGLEPTDVNLGEMANRLRAERGMDAIAQLCIDAVREQHAPLVLIDGIRGDAEVRVFRQNFPSFVLIGIDSSFETRFDRLGTRGRSDDTGSAATLRIRDERERSWGLDTALKLADIHIVNEDDLGTFTKKAQALLKELGRAP